MAGIRSLSGNSGNILNNVLFRGMNLADLNNVGMARSNLGLIGSLSANSSPYLTITSPFNGTANQSLNLLASSNATPNTLAVYNSTGRLVTTSLSSPYVGISAVIDFNANDLNNIDQLNCGTVSTYYIQQADPSGINFKNSFLSNVSSLICFGNVGIGSSVPRGSLDVGATGKIYTNYIVPSSSILDFNYANLQGITNIYCSTLVTTAAIQPPAIQTDVYQPLTPNGSIKFYQRLFSGTPLQLMTITNSGNVGIGTTNPAGALEVTGSI